MAIEKITKLSKDVTETFTCDEGHTVDVTYKSDQVKPFEQKVICSECKDYYTVKVT